MRARHLLFSAFLLGACASAGDKPGTTPGTGGSGGAPMPANSTGDAGGSEAGTGGGTGGSPMMIDARIDAMIDATIDSSQPIDAGTVADTAPGEPTAPHEPAPTSGFVEMNLFPGAPPNLKPNAPKEVVAAGGGISNVSIPTIRRYPLDESKATGTAFVVFPGGGYSNLNMEVHATALARRLGPLGIAVFALKYRVGGGTTDAPRDALLDAKRAIRLVRSKAAQWGLDPKRIGVISYSAGSHLDMNLVSSFDSGQLDSPDPVERQSCRPDFVASTCTWNFGSSTSTFKFTANTPPVFLCHARDDTTAPIALAVAIDQQLKTLGVLSHLEIYATGGHEAFDVGIPNNPGRDWPDKFLPWLKTNNLTP